MQKTFHLTEQDINAVIEDTRAYLVGKKVADKDILKLELFIEEALLRYRDKFGRGQEAVVETSSLPTAKIVIKLKAECFNPIMEDEESILSSEYLRNLMEIEGSSTTYRYRNGYNEIVAMAHRKPRKWKTPGGSVTIAVVLAIVASFLTKNLPESTISLLVNDLASPILSRIMGVIVLVTSPLICISVISGICALDDIATLSSIGLKAIRRFVVITLLMITFCVLVNLFIFPGISASGQGAISIAGIVSMLLDLIPQDMVSPFVESKTIQIIVIAIVIGISILMIGEKAPVLRELVTEVNQLLFNAMNLVAKLIPVAVFLSIYKAISLNSASNIMSVWKLVVANYASMVPFTVGMVLFVCLRRRLDVGLFLRDIAPATVIGFTTGSSTLAMTNRRKSLAY